MLDDIRRYWDEDAATYDRTPNHRPTDPAEQAAWSAALARLLPPAPARVLDVGAGTGFLTLLAAALGHRVTALDLSPGMLAGLRAGAAEAGVDVEVVEGPASEPPAGPFDAVVERHVVWTLPDPVAALRSWRAVAPDGRLLLVESAWGAGADPTEAVRARARARLQRLRRTPPHHHGGFPARVASFPLGRGTPPAALVELAREAGWGAVRLERLRDVEWAAGAQLPLPERLLGVPPRFVVVAG